MGVFRLPKLLPGCSRETLPGRSVRLPHYIITHCTIFVKHFLGLHNKLTELCKSNICLFLWRGQVCACHGHKRVHQGWTFVYQLETAAAAGPWTFVHELETAGAATHWTSSDKNYYSNICSNIRSGQFTQKC